jgi:antitoxin ParD1/3/4
LGEDRPTKLTNYGTLGMVFEGNLMAEGVNVRFAGELQKFIEQRIGASGLYASASEYIRDLVRRDYEREDQRKWGWLRQELKPGAEAPETDFVPLNTDKLIAEAKARKETNGS